MPEAFSSFRERLKRYPGGEKLLERAAPAALMSESSAPAAAGAATATFGALGNFLIMLFIGLYVALDPQSYRKGLLALLVPSTQLDGEDALTKVSNTPANWLIAQLMAMAVVGILTWPGLWLVGVPLAPILAFSWRCWPSFQYRADHWRCTGCSAEAIRRPDKCWLLR